MDADDLIENIKACRTCGIHYVAPSKHQLKHLFQSSLEHSELMLIRLELSQWNIEVAENDGFPQYVCSTCIHKFEQVFELRAACITAQNELRKFYAVPNGNIPNVKIKSELPDPDEEQSICDFIYVDDLSDAEYDGATPFNFPHIPIKEEVIEAAAIPMEESDQPLNVVESASGLVAQTGPSSLHIRDIVAAEEPSAAMQIAVEGVECKLCQHISSNQEEHQQHIDLAHETTDLECHICGKEFKNSTPARLKFHMKWHTLNKHVKCNLCGFVCNSKDALREHKRANHRKLNCKICGKGILAKKMKSHLRHHELISKYSCEYCTEAFATENERENHIWEIHANEDNNAASNPISAFQTPCSQTINERPFKVSTEEVSFQEAQESLYKFLCAHCEHKFTEQIDLERHVNEEHRVNANLVSIGPNAGVFVEEDRVIRTAEMVQNEQGVDERANIKLFQKYCNDDEIQFQDSDSTLGNTTVFHDFSLPSSSSAFVTQSGNIQCDESEMALKTSSINDSESRDFQDEANGNLSPYDTSNLNTFACAKCSETFAAIEQLRQHYEQHLAIDQQQQKIKTTLTKSKFKCNLCEKSFDLKFSLNRHVKKHKHAPV